jgi:hypothetical protein
MTRRKLLLSLVGVVGALTRSTALEAQQQPPRLVADNRTDYYADLYSWNGAGWNYVARLNPHSWMAFPNAASGSAWRAIIGQVVRDHVVDYVWDPGYGGWQDVWWIQ